MRVADLPTDETESLLRRRDVLEYVCAQSRQVRDVVDGTGHSRRTINRAISELEEIGLLERGGNGVRATPAGRLARANLGGFLEDYRTILTARELLDPLEDVDEVDPALFSGAELAPASEPTPYRALKRLQAEYERARGLQVVTPTLVDSRQVRLFYELVVMDGYPMELIVTPAVYESLQSRFARRVADMAETGTFTLTVGELPHFGMGRIDRGDGRSPLAYLRVLNRRGGTHGIVLNDSAGAVSWAERTIDRYRADAIDRTAAFEANRSDADVPPVGVRQRVELPLSLERQGFVLVDRSFFRDQPVADPATAWRSGLGLTEVHTGYAIPRFSPERNGPASESRVGDTHRGDSDVSPDRTDHGNGTDPAVVRSEIDADEVRDGIDADQVWDRIEEREHSSTGSDLASTLLDSLRAGSTVALLGPAGSGKSTVCKQVACRWYEERLGPVFYRQSDRGRRLAALETLLDAASAADGHALIVLEDAVRPGTSAIFEVLERLAEQASVSVLLDARESEWSRFVQRVEDLPPIDLHHVSALRRVEFEQLVAHFEATVGRPVEVSTDELWSAIGRERANETGSSHGMLRLIHRLSTYADPLSEGPTALEADVARVHDAVVDDAVTRRVTLLVNALNAAGVSISPGLCHLAVESGDEAAVVRALSALDGRILFGVDGDRLETVHEEWSVAFLEHAVSSAKAATREAFGTGVSTMFASVGDPERRDTVLERLDGDRAIEDLEADPETWTEEVLEALYDLVYRRCALVPLLADGGDHAIRWSQSCPDSLRESLHVRFVDALITAGRYDEAERALREEAWPGEGSPPVRLHQLAWLTEQRGNYERAIDRYEDALERAREREDEESACRILLGLGLSLWRSGRVDEAEVRLEHGRELASEIDSGADAARFGLNLGAIAFSRGEYSRAITLNEERRERAAATGDRYREARSLSNVGFLATRIGDYDRARTTLERALSLRRELGDRSGEAETLNNLGLLAARTDEPATARSYFEAAREIAADLDTARQLGESRRGLGLVAIEEGDLDVATEHLEAASETFERIGARMERATTTVDLGRVALERGDLRRAGTLLEDAEVTADEIDARHVVSRCHQLRGHLALAREDRKGAREHWENAVERFAESGAVDHALDVLRALLEEAVLDQDGIDRWSERARELLANAPEPVAERHGGWVEALE